MFKPYRRVGCWLIPTIIAALVGCASPAPELSPPTDMHVNLGITYLQQGNFEKARMALNQAIIAQPRAPSAWGAMAYLEEITGNLTLADRDYRHAIQLAPQQGEAHNNYGVFLCRHGQPRAGIPELLKATQLQSYVYRASAYENAGRCAQLIPDPIAADNYFKAALRNRNSR